MTRPPATRCTTASSPDAYARRSVLIDGQAFERLGDRIAEEGGAGLIESEQRVIYGTSRPRT